MGAMGGATASPNAGYAKPMQGMPGMAGNMGANHQMMEKRMAMMESMMQMMMDRMPTTPPK